MPRAMPRHCGGITSSQKSCAGRPTGCETPGIVYRRGSLHMFGNYHQRVISFDRFFLAACILHLSVGCAQKEQTYPVGGVVKFTGESQPARELAGGNVAFT